FADRGDDAVAVAEIERAADVSEGTVFNYFPAKEDLFYGQMESFESALVDAVRDRPAGESALAAFRRFVLDRAVGLDERAEVIAKAARIITASPTLQAREREVVESSTRSLAELLAAEAGPRGSNVEAWAVASSLMGVQRGLVRRVRANVLAGMRGAELVADVKAQGKRAFARLERGLGDYAVKKR